MKKIKMICVVLMLLLFSLTHAQLRDLSQDKTLYVVGYAHLDTQWRWDFITTIDEFVKNTLDENFERFEQFPEYTFNFTGSARYNMMKEYYPDRYARLKDYIKQGRWLVSGSSVDEGDVNVPSAEATIRQVLYGNDFFRKEFDKESIDFMLPDCFGFPASMPSIWAHCGLKGFSTQKLTWGSAVGIPFNVGVWEGPDGRDVICALNPGAYVGGVTRRLDTNKDWIRRVEENGELYGLFADYHYYGVGDMGGAPRKSDVEMVISSMDTSDGELDVVIASSDQMYKDITPAQKAKMPRFKGDMLLTEHSSGTLSSQAYMKRWNRKNELLADTAERAAVVAQWLGGAEYPLEKLNLAWERVLLNQMHDILPGTSLPKAYELSWNDEVLALNHFATVLEDSVGTISRALDTQTKGKPIVVYNSLAQDRTDLVEAEVLFPEGAPVAVRVFDTEGREVPSQILERQEQMIKVLFSARVPSVGLCVFDVRSSQRPYEASSDLKIDGKMLSNAAYEVTLNEDGDVASVIDKRDNNRQLLSAPARLEFLYEKPREYPAWNMDWADRQKAPVDYVKGPAKIRVVESGPVRVALEIVRETRDSIFTQQIRLAAGDAGKRVEFLNHIDWQSTECSLKHAFPLTVSNPKATYNWGLGTIERGNNDPKKYEVPSHEWFDLTDVLGKYGVSVLEDCKFGSDKPADNILRLTLLYTPGERGGFMDQATQDFGRHDMLYALYGHKGDWRQGQSEWQGRRLNTPLVAFQAPVHDGKLGRTFSMLQINTPQVDARALKKAENSNLMIVRMQELWGRLAEDVCVTFPAPIVEAYEVDGQERRIGKAKVINGKLALDMSPYSPRTFAVKLAKAPAKLGMPTSKTIALKFDSDVISSDDNRADGNLDQGLTLPAEMIPDRIISEGIVFAVGSSDEGDKNAMTCRGQKITLPRGNYNRVYLLAAATEDTQGEFKIDEQKITQKIQSWTGFIGQFDNRVWNRKFDNIDYQCRGRVVGLDNGYIKRDPVAWFASHRHTPERNDTYRFSYLFKYGLDLPRKAKTLTLPDNPAIKILAVTLSNNGNDAIRPVQPLYDDFSDRRPPELRVSSDPSFKVMKYHKGLKGLGKVTIDRKDRFEELKMGAPVQTDYADLNSGNSVTVEYVQDPTLAVPHEMSGAEGKRLPRLHDGQVAQNDNDTSRCVWYDQKEGRFVMDLKKVQSVKKVNTYSWHISDRGPQNFSLWGCNKNDLPNPVFSDPSKTEWEFLGYVNSWDLGQGRIHGSSVTGPEGDDLGAYRYLMWVVDPQYHHVFLTEIDVHVADSSR